MYIFNISLKQLYQARKCYKTLLELHFDIWNCENMISEITHEINRRLKIVKEDLWQN